MSCSRNWGAVYTSTSPCTDRTAQPVRSFTSSPRSTCVPFALYRLPASLLPTAQRSLLRTSFALSTTLFALSLISAPMRSVLPSRFRSSSSVTSPAASFIRPFVSSMLVPMPAPWSVFRCGGWDLPPPVTPLTGGGLGAGPVPELDQAPGQQSGHVHLADAEPGGDFRLGHAAEEPEVDDHLLPLREGGDQGGQEHALLHLLEPGVVLA